jgi:hypothetical protein
VVAHLADGSIGPPLRHPVWFQLDRVMKMGGCGNKISEKLFAAAEIPVNQK